MTARDGQRGDAAWRDRLTRYVLRERAAGRRDLLDLHALPLEARVEAGAAIAGLRFAGWDRETGRLVLLSDGNRSGFRGGDRLLLGRGDDPLSGLPVDYVDYDPDTGTLALAVPWGGDREALDALVRREPQLTLDRGDVDLSGLLLAAIGRIYEGEEPHARSLRDLVACRIELSLDSDEVAAARESLARLGARGLALRPSQAEAYIAAWAASPCALVQGPPGTGKTWLLALLLAAWAFRGERVLVSAFTHLAVDNALEQAASIVRAVAPPGSAAASRVAVVRVGARADQRAEYARRGITCCRAQDLPPATPSRARGLIAGATLFGAARLEAASFDRVAVDEAAQAAVPHALVGLAAGRRAVLFGDDRQLGPVVTGEHDGTLAPSIFAHLRGAVPPVMLEETWRMSDAICAFPSSQFYGGRLVPAEGVGARRLALPRPGDPLFDPALGPEPPALLISIDHEGYQTLCLPEVRAAADLAGELLNRGLEPRDLAVVSPFRVQNREIQRELARRLPPGSALPVIDTVERIQGQEREAVIVSLACSDPDALRRDASFFFSANRLNVTLTRARTKLVVIGSPHVLRTYPRSHEGLAQVDLFHRLFQELPRLDWTERYQVMP